MPATPTGSQDDESQVACAIFCYPEPITNLLFITLGKALESALRRQSIGFKIVSEHFVGSFCVYRFEVEPSLRWEAVDCVKNTMEALILMGAIAIYPVDGAWHTVHGIGLHQFNFDEVFLRWEDMSEFREKFKQYIVEWTKAGNALMDELSRRLAKLKQKSPGQSENQTPENPS